MLSLKERAEEYSLEEFRKIRLVNPAALRFPFEYLLSEDDWTRIPLYYMGPKGSGKTTIWRKALTEALYWNKDFLPVMFTFRHAKKLELLDPLKLAPPEVWKERMEVYRSNELDELLNLADVVVYDDIHYICEAVKDGGLDENEFVQFFKNSVELVEKGKKVVLISDDMLSYYAAYLDMEEFDEILPKFGMCNPKRLTDYEFIKRMNINYMSFREVPDLDYDTWEMLFPCYGIEVEYPVKYFLFNANRRPRAFVNFVKLFHPKSEITVDDMVRKAIRLLDENGRKLKRDKLEFYKFMLNFPILESGISRYQFHRAYKTAGRRLEVLEEIQNNFTMIKKICEMAAKRIELSEEEKELVRYPFYLLRKERNARPWGFRELIRSAVYDYFGLDRQWYLPSRKATELQKMAEKIEQLVHVYLRNPSITGIRRTYKTIVKMKETIAGDQKEKAEQHLRSLFWNVEKYYIALRDDSDRETRWLLYEPFRIAFQDVLYEASTLELLQRSGIDSFNDHEYEQTSYIWADEL